MLDDYKQQQPIVYKIMKNAVINQKISHAYLLDIKNDRSGKQMAIAFIKFLLCPHNKSNPANCGTCTQCLKIDNYNYTELKIIEPDGIWIKKNQLDELQEEFSKKALEGKYKIYVINQVEKLNKAAANSLLKFLEEPEEGIIAVLTTNSLFQVLETIRSRCQILTFTKQNKLDHINKVTVERLPIYIHTNPFDQKGEDKEKYNNFIHIVVKFLDSIEKRGKETLLYTTKLWHNYINQKEELILAFDIMIFFYSDVLHYKCGHSIRIFFDQKEFIQFVSENNDIKLIMKKIYVIMELKSKIKMNLNNALLIDKLILNLIGSD